MEKTKFYVEWQQKTGPVMDGGRYSDASYALSFEGPITLFIFNNRKRLVAQFWF